MKVFIDANNLRSGVSIEAEESLFPLAAFVFETPPRRYAQLLDNFLNHQEFRNEMSGIKFAGDLDEEDLDDLGAMGEDEVLVEHNEFGDIKVSIQGLNKVLREYLALFLLVQKTLPPSEAQAISSRLERLNTGA